MFCVSHCKFCCTPSTSGIEQNFILGQIRYTMQRRHSLPGTEELVLKLFYGLPKQSKDEKMEICKLARVAWANQYGRPRESSRATCRADKGIKRKQADAGLTERSFLQRRRYAAAAAGDSYSGTQGQADPQFFTEGHQKEMLFLEKNILGEFRPLRRSLYQTRTNKTHRLLRPDLQRIRRKDARRQVGLIGNS